MGAKKVAKKQAKKSEIYPLALFGVSQKHKANSHNMYAEDLGLADSVSVSLCEHCLVGQEGHVLLVFSILPEAYNVSFLSSVGFPKL